MQPSINFWMCFAGLIYLIFGVFLFRKDIGAARGWDKLIVLNGIWIAVSLAVFAPEHFGGPMHVSDIVPSWMPARWFWAPFVGCALLAAAASLFARKFELVSTALLGLMFFLFVCMLHIPALLASPGNRFVWAYALRDSTFCAGAWALAGLHSRVARPELSKWTIVSCRLVIGVAAIYFAVQHFLHPEFAPGFPLELKTPGWVPVPWLWGYLAGAILLTSGVFLIVNKKSRMAAAALGALMTALTLLLYVPIWILAHAGSTPEIMEAINYVFDTLLYAGAALALASALQRETRAVELG